MPILFLIPLALVLIALVLWLVFMILWMVLALIVRIIAWVLVALVLSVAVGLVCGVLRGVAVPPGVLRGRAEEVPRIATPDRVVDGAVLGKAPVGRSKGFGWDHAWPVYLPHQAARDANAVLAAAKRVGLSAPAAAVGLGPAGFLLLPAVLGFAVGVWASVLAWYLVMAVLGAGVWAVQRSGVLGYRWYDHLTRRSRKADFHCPKCYRVTEVPSYRCSGPACGTVHHDLRPGPLGIVHRRCGCGARIPATIGRAARKLVTVCPFCDEDAPEGSGTRRVLSLPVIGAVGAGKTQFLTSGVVELRDRARSLSGSLTAISPVAEEFLRTAATTVFSGRRVGKTAWDDRPEGVPLILSLGERQIEVQIMDAAGENFVSRERSQALGYIDTADTLLFVLDPLALPAVQERLRRAGESDSVPLAQGDQEDAYASVVDRLRAEGVRLRRKRLAVVMTKYDVLHRLPDAGAPDPADGGSVREWLRANGARGLVRRIRHDFRDVDYFAVDSHGTREGVEPFHPVRVLDRALHTAHPGLAVLPRMQTAAAGKERSA